MDQLIPICAECPDAMIQLDFFDESKSYPMGCKRLPQETWSAGWGSDAPGEPAHQHFCPRFTE